MTIQILLHHRGKISFLSGEYVGGKVTDLGHLDPDLISVTHLYKTLRQKFGYNNSEALWCKFKGEKFERGVNALENDSDVHRILSRLKQENMHILHVYVEYRLDEGSSHLREDEGSGQQPAEGGNEAPLKNEDAPIAEEDEDDLSEDELEDVYEYLSNFSETDDDEPELFGNSHSVDSEEVAEEMRGLERGNDGAEDAGALAIGHLEGAEGGQGSQADKAIGARVDAIDWFGHGAGHGVACGEDQSDEDDSEGFISMSEGDDSDSDAPQKRRRYKDFNEEDLKGTVNIEKGMRFRSVAQFKAALKRYSVQKMFDFRYIKNDKLRVRAECRKRCGWKIGASFMNRKEAFQVKTFVSTHNCGCHHKNRRLDVNFSATHYAEYVRDNPNLPPKALGNLIKRDFKVGVSRNHMYRAKKLAIEIVHGKQAEQYKYVWDYAAAITQWNPGSRVWISRDGPFFHRMYVRLEACKRGFMAGCRPMICVDGCHLKGSFGGQLLCAVTKDGNDDMFPIAIAVVEIENRSSWTWFIELLLQDIGYDDPRLLSWMSDRQKGLLDAFADLLGGAEQRHCVRHLHANFKSHGFKGQAFKDELFGAARACTKGRFDYHMENIKKMNPKAFKYLDLIDPTGWSRHAFRTTTKCDILLNNIAETFNSWIKDARDKPILTMLETIRRQLMNRFVRKRECLATATWDICPRIRRKLERNKDNAKYCVCEWTDGGTFEVDMVNDGRKLVNIGNKTCTCGRWQLNGIPCAHACAALYSDRQTPEDYVDDCYSKAAYTASYAPTLHAMPGPDEWPHISVDDVLPPRIKARPGRPKKARKRAADEPQLPYRVTRQGYDVRCGKCGVVGHNARTCRKPDNPNRRIYPKKPSKKKNSNVQGTEEAGPSTVRSVSEKSHKRKKATKIVQTHPATNTQESHATDNGGLRAGGSKAAMRATQ